MLKCPKCASTDVILSRTRGRWEVWRRQITHKRPYRCRTCSWRGWGVDMGPIFPEQSMQEAANAIAPAPPDLSGTGFTLDEAREPLDVRKLDVAIEPRRQADKG